MSLDGWMPVPHVNEHNEEQEHDLQEQDGDYYGEQNDDLGDGSFVQFKIQQEWTMVDSFVLKPRRNSLCSENWGKIQKIEYC